MAPEELEVHRKQALAAIRDAKERKRIRAVSYAEAIMNIRDGIPLFGFPAAMEETRREFIRTMIRSQPSFQRKVLH